MVSGRSELITQVELSPGSRDQLAKLMSVAQSGRKIVMSSEQGNLRMKLFLGVLAGAIVLVAGYIVGAKVAKDELQEMLHGKRDSVLTERRRLSSILPDDSTQANAQFVAADLDRMMAALEVDAAKTMRDIEIQVAQDSVEQYEIAKDQGDRLQICVQAGFVSAAWLQAKNKDEYNKWKGIEKKDCARAGLR